MLLIAFAPFFVGAQTEVAFEAFSDAKQVLVNGIFEVSFTLKNAEGQNFQPPDFRDFVVASGPSRSMSTTIVNGKFTKSLTHSYTLRPRRQGRFTIGSATVVVNGRTWRTEPLVVEVVKGKTDDPDEQQEALFVQAESDLESATLGQQIILDYKLYTTVDVETYNVLEESDYQGFYAEDVREHPAKTISEVIDGIQYATKIVKRVALFPQQAGKLTVEPMLIQLGVSSDAPRKRNNFFFNRKLKRVSFETAPFEIVVAP